MPSTETFAANHGQNSCAGRPFRSASAITLSPLLSTESARVSCTSSRSAMVSPHRNGPVQSCSITVSLVPRVVKNEDMLSNVVDGFRLAYDRIGDGPAVVLLHGWPGDRTDYRVLAPILAERGFEVVVPDLRGFGESDAA